MKFGTMCYLKSKGKTLFVYRTKGEKDIHNGFYVPPGGKAEAGENGIECIIREFKEETGLTLINPKLRQIILFDNRDRVLGGISNHEDFLVLTYEATEYSGELQTGHPQEVPTWVEDDKIKSIKMREGDLKIIELLKTEGIYEVVVKSEGDKLVRFDYKKVGSNF